MWHESRGLHSLRSVWEVGIGNSLPPPRAQVPHRHKCIIQSDIHAGLFRRDRRGLCRLSKERKVQSPGLWPTWAQGPSEPWQFTTAPHPDGNRRCVQTVSFSRAIESHSFSLTPGRQVGNQTHLLFLPSRIKSLVQLRKEGLPCTRKTTRGAKAPRFLTASCPMCLDHALSLEKRH